MMDGTISGFMIDLGIQGVEGSWSVENSLLEPYKSDPQRRIPNTQMLCQFPQEVLSQPRIPVDS